ncbi:MAG TPA: hypothetical protein VIT41_15965 [Microlunatus sp.]
MSTVDVAPRRRSGWARLRWLLGRAWAMEIHGYQSIYRFVFRRPRVPTGSVAFTYSAPILSILIVFTVLSAVELVVVDLIVHRWAPGLRVPLLVLGLWGLVWLIGLLLGVLTRPHAVGPDGIRVRFAADVDIPLSWDDVYSVARRRRTRQDDEPALIVADDGSATLHVRVGDETNLEIVLERDLTVRTTRGPEVVRRIALYADDPTAYLDEVRRHLG